VRFSPRRGRSGTRQYVDYWKSGEARPLSVTRESIHPGESQAALHKIRSAPTAQQRSWILAPAGEAGQLEAPRKSGPPSKGIGLQVDRQTAAPAVDTHRLHHERRVYSCNPLAFGAWEYARCRNGMHLDKFCPRALLTSNNLDQEQRVSRAGLNAR
jgi:hypothetical protein